EPGAQTQRFRFSVPPESLGAWIERAEEWLLRTQLDSQEELRRLTLAVQAPGRHHVGLQAAFPSVEDLPAADARHRDQAQRPAARHSGPWPSNQHYLGQGRGHQDRRRIVFPAGGEPTVVLPLLDEALYWRQLVWVEDIRGGNRFGKAIADRIKELGLQSATIG